MNWLAIIVLIILISAVSYVAFTSYAAREEFCNSRGLEYEGSYCYEIKGNNAFKYEIENIGGEYYLVEEVK